MDAYIVGVGYSGFDSVTPGVSYKEMMYEAAVRAYEDSGVDPRKDVQSFVCSAEDFWDGNAITDIFMPDQLGAVQRPLCTVAGEGLQGLATAVMQVATGVFDVVVVEAHSKLSDVLSKNIVLSLGLDPLYHRSLGCHPYYLGGLEMKRFLHDSGNTVEQCADVVVKNRENALLNHLGTYGSRMTRDDVLNSKPVAEPLRELDIAQPGDGCVVLVLASSYNVKVSDRAVPVKGVGWSSDTPSPEGRDFSAAAYSKEASKLAYRMAEINDPERDLSFAEVDDTFSFKELQHLESLGLAGIGEAGKRVEGGDYSLAGTLPVNPSGGSLGVGWMVEASGLRGILEAVQQIRGEAGSRQIEGAKAGLVQSWRGIPTATGAVAILGDR